MSKESNFLPCYKGTVILDNCIESPKSCFQAHLERISNFLISGPGKKGNGTVVFRDGNKDLCFRGDHLYNTSPAVVSQMYSILLLKCGMNY